MNPNQQAQVQRVEDRIQELDEDLRYLNCQITVQDKITADSNNSPPPLIVTLTPLGYIAPRSKGTWYFPKVYGIIAKAVQCLSMCFNSLPYLHL